ncbi:Proline-rich receptor-like protein kinase PERK13 [Heracleum sosnowskyi]|uniref:Proline-rich receptor-like protein kinase PERK13 n=1 Tax=Heracleum sosnowskyi TaxID=360622 RepID=A0AAD8M967_9APIA|nr:Proline-rich receptor-like protein kinase PERK13 [Heracleum sosnowskyi]
MSKGRGLNVEERQLIVAVKASKGISTSALVWALTHVVQPGDCVKLLVVVPVSSSSKKLWGFRKFGSDCTSGHWRSLSETVPYQDDIADSCSEMMLQLGDVYDIDKIKLKVKVLCGSPSGVVAAEGKKAQTHWVILDKQLKKEAKLCMEELECNLVLMKKSEAKVLRLNLIGSSKVINEISSAECLENDQKLWKATRVPNVTPTSSPEHESVKTADAGTVSPSNLNLLTSPFVISDFNWDLKAERFLCTDGYHSPDESDLDTDSGELSSPSTSSSSQPWMRDAISSSGELSKYLVGKSHLCSGRSLNPVSEALRGKFCELDRDHKIKVLTDRHNQDSSKNLRATISYARSALAEPPPLCSACQHKAPVFGKPPQWFTYAELENATDGFSEANFLAEGGFGSVHKGTLPDGQVIAVKQHKPASSQGDHEFCSEVEVLSCAQHRNVVMLIGLCVDDRRRLLVYEYICNRSLDHHLYVSEDALEWSARRKIAVGAARGLRYLHEECRVGCIVHRDMRPNNILLTHDFEPLVGDFGLARWQPEGDMGVETRVIGTFGYLAPEYTQTGEITEKADVYSFGVILVELITGRKAIDLNRPKGHQCLTEWARPLLEKNAIKELTDPRLRDCYSEKELDCMVHCASLCIRQDPHSRPRMSQVLWMLEGDNSMG